MTLEITSLSQLEEFSKILLEYLPVDEKATVLALSGDLGTGKTTLVQYLGARLGVTATITSPTFLVMKHYPVKDSRWQMMIHMDFYRVETADELRVLKFEAELKDKNNLICIEWAERYRDLIPQSAVWVTLSHGNGGIRTIVYGKS